MFTSPVGFDDQEAIAVDSAAIEAIEPDWVEHQQELVGVYGASVDSLMRVRSISGVQTRTGTDKHVTNGEWAYDNDGNLTNTSVPSSEITYSAADLINLCRMRGPGFSTIDYEMHKDLANLILAIVGDRDIQARCGYGCGHRYTTGANNFNSFGNITRFYTGSNIGNIMFGIQNFIGCNWEWMDNVAINVKTFVDLRRNRYSESVQDFPVDGKWHIHNPITKTERVVQGLTTSGFCIGRVKHGRYCDIIASRVTTDTSKWNQNYADVFYITNSRSRLVLRSGVDAVADFGLVYAGAYKRRYALGRVLRCAAGLQGRNRIRDSGERGSVNRHHVKASEGEPTKGRLLPLPFSRRRRVDIVEILTFGRFFVPLHSL